MTQRVQRSRKRTFATTTRCVILCLALTACDTQPPPAAGELPPASETTLAPDLKTVFVAIDESSYEEYARALKSADGEKLVTQTLLEKLVKVAGGTKVVIVYSRPSRSLVGRAYEIGILEGERKGQKGWVNEAYLEGTKLARYGSSSSQPPSRAPSRIPIGVEKRLSSHVNQVLVAVDEAAYDKRAFALRPEYAGRFVMVDGGTRVLIIDSSEGKPLDMYQAYKIRILEGRYAGKTGWLHQPSLE
jgi:hypothetical protein